MTKTMPAVGYRRPLPVTDPECLIDVELPVPAPDGSDLLVEVAAVSVNPVDVKVRANADPGGEVKVLGYDAAGTVVAVGPQVSRFQPGDEVWYAGSIGRPGTNSRYHLVDEHVVGRRPASLDAAQAAALPLTTITAWEALFDKFRLGPDSTGTLLVVGAAGGVGSVLVQLARQLTRLTIVGTGGRPESRDWALRMGAHEAVDHRGGLADAALAVAPDGVDYLVTAFTAGQVEQFARVLRPGGHIVAIDDPGGVDVSPLKNKSISWHWEFMFTRPLYARTDPYQHELLTRAAQLVDEGRLRTTLTSDLGPIRAESLRRAHAQVETSTTIGKVVLAGW
jgi:NADPH:quinone reductase